MKVLPRPASTNAAFPAYQQFLHLGEAGLATSIYFVNACRNRAPETERQDWGAHFALEVFRSRLGLVTRQLARSLYMAGDAFTAADISVTYALELAQRGGSVVLGEAEQAYVARMCRRNGYLRAMEACHDTRAWVARLTGRSSEGEARPSAAPDSLQRASPASASGRPQSSGLQ